MKLWRSLKTSMSPKPSSSVEAQSRKININFGDWTETQIYTYELEDFKSRTSLSTDSGLPTERYHVRHTTVELVNQRGLSHGIILAGRSEPGTLPTIAAFKKESAAQESDRFTPGDRISSINGIGTSRLTNDEVLTLLDNVEERASLEIEYYMPNYASQNSLCITTKVTEITLEKINGSLGITLRGGDGERSGSVGCAGMSGPVIGVAPRPLLVTHVRPGGSAYNTGRIKPGDRLIKVDQISLVNKTLAEAHQILQNSPRTTTLTIEYDISIMESVKFASGPLLIEIERPSNENLGIILTSKSYTDECYSPANETHQNSRSYGNMYIDRIVPASIGDRCGALHPGDQLIAVDDLIIENAAYTPEEIMCFLDTCPSKGFTQLHIAPVHLLLKNSRFPGNKGLLPGTPPISGMSTLNSRRSHKQRNFRQSSIPKCYDESEPLPTNYMMGVGVCRSESLTIQLEIPPNQDSGIAACEERDNLVISHISPQSPAYRCGCLQPRDRIISINNYEHITLAMANDILQRRNESSTMRYLSLNIEFSLADSVEASSGIFNVKLVKNTAGLGITITGCKQQGSSSGDPMTISDIKVGSIAHRSGTLAVGDELLAIDSKPLHNLSLDAAFNILQNSPDDIITLTIKKSDGISEWSDIQARIPRIPVKPQLNVATLTTPKSTSVQSSDGGNDNSTNLDSNNGNLPFLQEENDSKSEHGEAIFDLELVKLNDGPLGLTIAGSEDSTQPIVLSGLVKGGLAENSGILRLGDEIMSINGESVLNKPLSDAIKLLQNNNQRVQLKISRKVTGANNVILQTRNNDINSRDSNSTHSQSSPGLSNDSAVESWDSQHTPIRISRNFEHDETVEYAVPNKLRSSNNQESHNGLCPYLPTDENKLIACGYKKAEAINENYEKMDKQNANQVTFQANNVQDYDKIEKYDCENGNENRLCIPQNQPRSVGSGSKSDYVPMIPYNISPINLNSQSPFRSNWDNDSNSSFRGNETYNNALTSSPNFLRQINPLPTVPYQVHNSFQVMPPHGYEAELPGLYNMERLPNRGNTHHVTLYKDAIYDDYGFSVSDGLYERGVYINRIRKGGPADIVGMLRPYDRILQVNGTRTVDFDCCLTVPLIASAGDRIELVLHRLQEIHGHSGNGVIITKTI